MLSGPREANRLARKKRLLLFLSLGAALFALIIAFAVTRYSPTDGTDKTAGARTASKAKGLADKGRYVEAAQALSRAAQADPDNKDIRKQLDAIIAQAVQQIQDDIAAGNIDQAKKDLDELAKIDPNNEEIDKIKDDLNNQPPAPSDDSTSAAPPANDDATTAPGLPAKLKDKSTLPAAVVPSKISGYKTENTWDQSSLAGAAYRPDGAELQKRVDAVLLTIGRMDPEDAQKRLDEEKKIFNEAQAQISISGGKRAFSGKSAGIVTVVWTQSDWFFSVQVIQNDDSSIDYFRGVALEIINKLGV